MAPEDRIDPDQQEVIEIPDDSDSYKLAERIAYHLLDRKIDDVVIMDLRDLSDVCDFFVLGTGQVDVQVRAGAKAVRDGLLDLGQKPVGSEGENEARWILLDYVDVVVHVLKPAVRQYYQLERLWGDARMVTIDIEYLSSQVFCRHHPDLKPAPGAPGGQSAG
jgi:ribosome-associated protein